jgi:hypothetical protein
MVRFLIVDVLLAMAALNSRVVDRLQDAAEGSRRPLLLLLVGFAEILIRLNEGLIVVNDWLLQSPMKRR